MIVNFEYVRIWKEHVMRYRKVLSLKSLAETEESNEKLNKLSH
jgi:hypothetical protein